MVTCIALKRVSPVASSRAAGVPALLSLSRIHRVSCSSSLYSDRPAQQLAALTHNQAEQRKQQQWQSKMGRKARRRLQQRSLLFQEREQLQQQADEQHLESLETAALAKQVHVVNLRFEATAANVKDFFSRFGTVASVSIAPAGAKSRSRTASSGRGVVEFTDAASAAQVLARAAQGGVLSAPGIGHRSSVRVLPARRGGGNAYRQTGADEFTFDVLQLDIGSMFDNATMIVEESIQQTCKLVVSFQERCIRLTLPLAGVQHQLIAHVRHVRRWLQLTADGCIVFTLKQPPVVLKTREDPFGQPPRLSRPSVNSLTWPPVAGAQMEWALAGDPTPDGKMGSCLTYRLKLSSAGSLPTKLLQQLQSFRLLPRNKAWLQPGAQQLSPVKAVSASEWQVQHGTMQLRQQLKELPWEVAYQVLRLLTEGVTTEWHVTLPIFMGQLLQASAHFAARALEVLSAAGDVLRSPAAQLKGLLQEMAAAAEAAETEEELPSHFCQVARVHVTPTRVKVQPIELDFANRIIRHFCSLVKGNDGAGVLDPSCFLRVAFGDEDGDVMFSRGDLPLDAFYDRMLSVLAGGITLCGRHFRFLAYSSSQLKEQACWMVATDGTSLSPDIMRAWMGDFMTSIRVPAKCAARMGQCFSTTVSGGLTNMHIADVERNGYCFSDGVGRISPQLLASMLAGLPYVTAANAPISAIQVRIAGCKGVLSLKPDVAGKRVQVRPSMTKFASSHSQLEVASIAQLIPCYFNRHVIMLLVHNGVPEQVFLGKQRAMLDQLQAMQDNAAKAAKLLPCYGGVQPSARTCMAALLATHAHVCSRHAPVGQLMSSCLHAVAVYHAHELKTKARLFVEEGAVLMGVMDEFELLQEGEVFAQVQANAERPATVITGPVMLAKHPVMHPGDVRRAHATDHPLLRAAYDNVLVFSQHGRRPLPNELSGSDLDGDLYSIMWDQDLITERNDFEAMDYTAPKPNEVEQVTVLHLLEHFVDHARNQNLGRIAIAWLGHADLAGPGCSECLQLAQLHSLSVDFPKTGVPAIMPKELVTKACPHWLENTNKDSYHSTSVLGQMYDQLQTHPLLTHQQQRPQQRQAQQQQQQQQRGEEGQLQANGHAEASEHMAQNGFCARSAGSTAAAASTAGIKAHMASSSELLGGAAFAELAAPGFKAHVVAARWQAERFVDALLALANRYYSYNMGELLTGCIIGRTPQQRRRHYDMREQLEHERKLLFDNARRVFVVQLLEGAGLKPEHVAMGQPSMGQASSSTVQPAAGGPQQQEEGDAAASSAAAVLSAATAAATEVTVAAPAADGPSSSSTAQAPAAAARGTASWADFSLQQLEAVLDRLMPLNPAAIAAGPLSSSSARCQKAAAYHFVATEAAGAAEAAGKASVTEDDEAEDDWGADGTDWGADDGDGSDARAAGSSAAAGYGSGPVALARSAFGWVVWRELVAMVMVPGTRAGRRPPPVLYEHFEGLRLVE